MGILLVTTETKDKRELIAEDINNFISGLNMPTFLLVEAKDLTLLEGGGVRVAKTIGDVSVTVDIGAHSLMHLAMIRGFIDTGKMLLGRS